MSGYKYIPYKYIIISIFCDITILVRIREYLFVYHLTYSYLCHAKCQNNTKEGRMRFQGSHLHYFIYHPHVHQFIYLYLFLRLCAIILLWFAQNEDPFQGHLLKLPTDEFYSIIILLLLLSSFDCR